MTNGEDYIDAAFNSIVGSVLKKEREKQNISLEDLAKKIHYKVKRQTLFYYETGRSKVKVATFIEICNALHLNPEEIFEEINMKYFKSSNLNAKKGNDEK